MPFYIFLTKSNKKVDHKKKKINVFNNEAISAVIKSTPGAVIQLVLMSKTVAKGFRVTLVRVLSQFS